MATKFEIKRNLPTLSTQNLSTIFSKSKEPETHYLINSKHSKVQTEDDTLETCYDLENLCSLSDLNEVNLNDFSLKSLEISILHNLR